MRKIKSISLPIYPVTPDIEGKSDDRIFIKYDSVTYVIKSTDKDYVILFENGILYPALLGHIYRQRISLYFYESKCLSKKKGVRRFRIMIWYENVMNPFMHIVELYSEYSCNQETELSCYFKNAKLLYIKDCGMH